MLAEKKTLLVPLVPWLTGCKAGLPGHLPFWASASISVPGAPASSLATGSQVLVSNPGVEICAPVWVAMALLCTAQPPEPRLVTSLAPVSDGERTLALIVPATPDEAARDGTACVVDATHSSAAAETLTVAQLTTVSRMARLMATPVPRPLPRTLVAPAWSISSDTFQTNRYPCGAGLSRGHLRFGPGFRVRDSGSGIPGPGFRVRARERTGDPWRLLPPP